MKTFVALLIAAGFCFGVASAQTLSGNVNRSPAGGTYSAGTPAPGADITGFASQPGYNAPGTTSKGFPNPNVVLKPKLGGILVDGPKYGSVMVSPTAPMSYGIGAKYLAAPDARYDLQHESGFAAHRETGGFKLLSFEF